MLKILFLVALSAVFVNGAVAKDDVPITGENYVLKSRILNEERPYSVYLPIACKEGGKKSPCPVLYMLDGNAHFYYASGMLKYMSDNNQIPATILVAIPNTTDRTRDLTPTQSVSGVKEGEKRPELASSGGGDAFLDFLEQELIPEVEARYQPMPFRLFSGHSLGGLIALHSFVERPNLFQAHLAVDPSLWWDNKELVKRAEKYLQVSNNIRNNVFITIAEHEPRGESGATVMETASERFVYALKANVSPNLKSGIRQFKGEDHGSVPLLSLYYGLLFVFDGYKNIPPAIAGQGLSTVRDYYQNYLGAYGIELTPPESVILNLARMAEENGRYDIALDYHRYNLQQNPDSAYAHFANATTLRKAGKTDLAIAHYKKTVELDSNMAAYVKSALADIVKE